jgi:Ca-activated chloride channel family protein
MKPVLASLSAACLLAVAACNGPTSREPGISSADVDAQYPYREQLREEREQTVSVRRPVAKAESGNSTVNTLNRVTGVAASPGAAVLAPQDSARLVRLPADRENYSPVDDNGVQVVRETPVSTFSIDVDTASYSNVRRMLMQEGRLPPHDAVRIEEMVNYFRYDYPDATSADAPFSLSMELAPAPWDPRRHLLQIGLEGYQPARAQRPAANLVFLVDVSGSMRNPNKLGLVQRSLNLLLQEMDENDRIALVVYAGAAGLVLDSTPADRKARIRRAINSLTAGGSTNGGAGIRLAYDVATEHFIKDGINRVIIASDGDMNVGTVDLNALKNLISAKRETGVGLTTLGFGGGNFNDALMEQLADAGNGSAAYIDSIREAQKVLVEQMDSTLMTIAKDVKIQVEFNPAEVLEYRLIGYENRMLRREDFRNDKVDAGEIGAGHTVTALYELVLADSDAAQVPDLRYAQHARADQDYAANGVESGELAYIRIRYKQPDASTGTELGQAILKNMTRDSISSASANLRFSAAVAGFGQLLRGGRFTGQWGYDEAIELARGARGEDPHGYRSEFVAMARLAKSVSATY